MLYKKTVENRIAASVVVITALLMPYFFTAYVGGGILNWQGALRYFCFFYMGILFFRYDCIKKMKSLTGAVLIVVYLLVCIYRKEQTVGVAFVGIWGFVILSKQLADRFPSLLKSFRDYSFQIFLLGIYPQMFVELFLVKKFAALWMQSILLFLCVLLGLYVPVLVARCAQKLGNKYINMILGLK